MGLMEDRVYQTAIQCQCRRTEAASDRRLGRHEAQRDQQGF